MIAKLKAKMKRWIERSGMSEEELYLSDSADYADLKNRMRILDERRRHQNYGRMYRPY
jgi:hypothetical protein